MLALCARTWIGWYLNLRDKVEDVMFLCRRKQKQESVTRRRPRC